MQKILWSCVNDAQGKLYACSTFQVHMEEIRLIIAACCTILPTNVTTLYCLPLLKNVSKKNFADQGAKQLKKNPHCFLANTTAQKQW